MASIDRDSIASYHCRRHSYDQIVRDSMCPILAHKLTHQAYLSCGQPEPNVRQSIGNLNYCEKMFHALQIPAVVPTKEAALFFSADKFNHGILPMWILIEGIQSTLKGILHIGKHVPTFACIA